MVINYAVPVGRIKLVCYDDRQDSPTRGRVQEVFLGEDSYQLVTVPPGVWNGFKAVGGSQALVANCATIAHRPDEITRKDPFSPDIPYTWDVRHG
jgi:dTDP-4-dehydrorhamnose 3,5-epimerase